MANKRSGIEKSIIEQQRHRQRQAVDNGVRLSRQQLAIATKAESHARLAIDTIVSADIGAGDRARMLQRLADHITATNRPAGDEK